MSNQNFPIVTFYRPLENELHIDEFFDSLAEENMPLTLFAGRSNVGKSSLINAVFGGKTAKTSKTPGRTQAINIFKFSTESPKNNKEIVPFMYFLDLPGFGYAKVSKEMRAKWNKVFSYFFDTLPKSTIIFHLQDARHPFTDIDNQFLEFLGFDHFETYLLLNKFDKLKSQKLRAELEKNLKSNKNLLGFYNHVIKCSAEHREGLADILKPLKRIMKQR